MALNFVVRFRWMVTILVPVRLLLVLRIRPQDDVTFRTDASLPRSLARRFALEPRLRRSLLLLGLLVERHLAAEVITVREGRPLLPRRRRRLGTVLNLLLDGKTVRGRNVMRRREGIVLLNLIQGKVTLLTVALNHPGTVRLRAP